MLYTLAQIIFIIIFIYVCIVLLYMLVVAIAGNLHKSAEYGINTAKSRIAVIIPAYREDDVVVHTALAAKKHNYPASLFQIYIAADQLRPETVAKLRAMDVNVQEVSFEISSKARSLNALLNNINEDDFDIALILDADNIILPDVLEKINDAFQHGFKAVQIHRSAKNTNSPIAVLDAITEEINNHLFRKGQRALGFSSNTIGSGMAFEFRKLKDIYNKPGILSNPACDREVDFEIMKSGIEIEYIEDAVVLDEKVPNRKIYERQRTRWLESQLIHIGLFFSRKEKIPIRNRQYWNKLFTNLIPPRLMFPVLFIIIGIVYFIQSYFQTPPILVPIIWWVAVMVLFILIILLSAPRLLFTKKALKALLYLPALFFSFIKALFSIKRRRKEFLHTPKTFHQDSKM